MATLGTRKFYKSFNSQAADKNQILKNSGYISIVLHSVMYNSKGNFWQRVFGGNDDIALSSTITYKSSNRTIEAKSIVDKRKVKANRNHILGLSRLVALKIPAIADGLEMKVEFTAVSNDNFENGLNLMNSEEFQKPLQLSAIPIGQILSVTSVIKKIFTGIDNPSILESTYAGIISKDKVQNPVAKERMTAGYILMIANNDEDNSFLSQADESKFTIDGDGLKYDNKSVTNTNIVFSVTYEPLKGVDEESVWFKKYRNSLNKLDDIIVASDESTKKRILDDSRKLWIEGNALLFNDSTYIDKEKDSIKISYLKKINERYTDLTQVSESTFVNSFFKGNEEIVSLIPDIKSFEKKKIVDQVNRISSGYFKDLEIVNKVFPQ